MHAVKWEFYAWREEYHTGNPPEEAFFFRLSKSGGGSSDGGDPSFAEAMAAEYRKYQEEHGIADDELEEFGE